MLESVAFEEHFVRRVHWDPHGAHLEEPTKSTKKQTKNRRVLSPCKGVSAAAGAQAIGAQHAHTHIHTSSLSFFCCCVHRSTLKRGMILKKHAGLAACSSTRVTTWLALLWAAGEGTTQTNLRDRTCSSCTTSPYSTRERLPLCAHAPKRQDGAQKGGMQKKKRREGAIT